MGTRGQRHNAIYVEPWKRTGRPFELVRGLLDGGRLIVQPLAKSGSGFRWTHEDADGFVKADGIRIYQRDAVAAAQKAVRS